MIFQVNFGASQTGLGYRFFDKDGQLLGSRTTSGISDGPASGHYLTEATPPETAVGIYWDSDSSEFVEDLSLRLALDSLDVWSTEVPGSYSDGTAGSAVGRLNNTPADTPIITLPDPAESSDLITCYIDTVYIIGLAVSGLKITISTTEDQPLVVDGKLVEAGSYYMTESEDTPGRYTISLLRGVEYSAENWQIFGQRKKTFETPASGGDPLNISTAPEV